MISWGGRFSVVLHFYGIFMFDFLRINIQLHGSSLSKEDRLSQILKLTNSSPDALMAVIISSSCSYTTGKSELPPTPTPPPKQKRFRLINDFSGIAWKLTHIQRENFQWQHTTFFLRLFVCRDLYLFYFLKSFRIKATNQQ